VSCNVQGFRKGSQAHSSSFQPVRSWLATDSSGVAGCVGGGKGDDGGLCHWVRLCHCHGLLLHHGALPGMHEL